MEFVPALIEAMSNCLQKTPPCLDWHSAVAAQWGLLYAARISYRATPPPKIPNWRDHPEELPYGYAWFLWLAREAGWQAEGDLVAQALRDYLWVTIASPGDKTE